jgi:hypothetical protein
VPAAVDADEQALVDRAAIVCGCRLDLTSVPPAATGSWMFSVALFSLSNDA